MEGVWEETTGRPFAYCLEPWHSVVEGLAGVRDFRYCRCVAYTDLKSCTTTLITAMSKLKFPMVCNCRRLLTVC